MVVACERRVTASGTMRYSSIAARVPSMTASPKSFGVVDTLATPTRPLVSSRTATSVNVPPMSTPMRHPIVSCPSLPCESALDDRLLRRGRSDCRTCNTDPMRFFNTSGPVVPADHYCIPPLTRVDLDDVCRLVRNKRYFVLQAPRQTDKTSVLLALRDLLNSGSVGGPSLRLRWSHTHADTGSCGERTGAPHSRGKEASQGQD